MIEVRRLRARNEKCKSFVLSLFIHLALAVAALSGCGETDDSSEDTGVDDPTKLDCVSNPDPLFTYDITDLELVSHIVPLGAPSGNEIKPHTYVFNVANIPDSRGVPVYAPVDSSLKDIAYYVSGERNEFLLVFRVSCEVTFRFDHIQIVVDAIKNVAPTVPSADSKTTAVKSKVIFKAGELIGYTRGTPQARSWDFGVYNTRKANQFINNKRYEDNRMEYNLHSDCPYDYFADDRRALYYSMFASPGGIRNPNATCRNASRDKIGTVAGAWFLDSGSDQTYERQIAIASELNGEVRVVGLGGSQIVDGTGTDPEMVTTERCYSDGAKVAFFRVVSDSRMDVYSESMPECPANFPGSGFKAYTR